jgi:hypothetical protein
MSDILTTYQHFKGGIYIKLCEAKHSENNETLVIYVCAVSGEIYARPKAMFYDQIVREDYTGPRFMVIPPFASKEEKKKIRVIPNGSS